MTDHSQCGETQWILDNLKPEPNGKFIEVGAFDGVQSSNTFLLEQLGWTGMCIEADPILAAQCSVNRKCQTLCAAAGDCYGLGGFKVNRDDRGLSGLSQKWDETIWVPMVRLSDILLIYNNCNLLSIDTEGTELAVWNGRGSFNPDIVIMEYQTRDLPPNDVHIISQMTKDGYNLAHRTQYNLIFTHMDYGGI